MILPLPGAAAGAPGSWAHFWAPWYRRRGDGEGAQHGAWGRGDAGGPGAVSLQEGRLGDLVRVSKHLRGGVERTDPGSLWWCPWLAQRQGQLHTFGT